MAKLKFADAYVYIEQIKSASKEVDCAEEDIVRVCADTGNRCMMHDDMPRILTNLDVISPFPEEKTENSYTQRDLDYTDHTITINITEYGMMHQCVVPMMCVTYCWNDRLKCQMARVRVGDRFTDDLRNNMFFR